MTHYCRVCNREFNCAGTLGGHMRSHTVGDQADKSRSDDHEHMNDKHSNVEGQKHSYSYALSQTVLSLKVEDTEAGDDDIDDDKGVMPNGSIATFSSSPHFPDQTRTTNFSPKENILTLAALLLYNTYYIKII
ncbi:unnamed protein product [Cuscuta epithymum]|uniref:C2H2-type domain-containing protein n=1 Tax=Cuscuta epithymum TaxID=186058 RepID=A0AAV0CSC0_9ASTE|nr:unnamed protein product [Cuscuta epithymum]